MNIATVAELSRHEGQAVELRGWLYRKREGGKIVFLLIRDGTGIVQGVVTKAQEEAFQTAKRLTQESSLIVRGTVKADPRAPGGYELQLSALEPVHLAQAYPITPKPHGAGFLMDHRHLWIRSAKQVPLLRLRHEVMQAIRDFFHERGFVATEAPVLTPISVEGTTTLFETDYFDRPAYLSQSGQLYLEATAMALGKVYWIGPAFRAERSKTRKHLTEFWMAEAEMAFCDHEENLALQEALVKAVIARVLERRGPELAALGRDRAPLERVLEEPFARITYDEAIHWLNRDELIVFMAQKWLQRRGLDEEEVTSESEGPAERAPEALSPQEARRIAQEQGLLISAGEDFGAPHEEALGAHFGRPVFVEKFPATMKPFYMEPDPEDERRVLNADLIASEGYGELIGGSSRVFRLEVLERKLAAAGLPQEPYAWYLDLRRYGSVPHAGFGLGVERTVAWLAGVAHLRECIPFPRQIHRLAP